MLSGQELEALFDAHVPYLFQKELTALVGKCYSEADSAQHVHGLCASIARWHLPFIRRSLIQSQALELARAYSELQPALVRTKDGGNPYLEIKAGPFVITSSKVDAPSQLPRDAEFRTCNSQVNYSLFEREEKDSDSAPIYAILTDVPHVSESRPAYLQFAFPDSDYTTTLHRIDLLDRFFALDARPAANETPAANPQPTLRKRKRGEEEAQA